MSNRQLMSEYDNSFLSNNENFLNTYQNTLSSLWFSTDMFFNYFKRLVLPGDLYYRLWLVVTKIRVTIMASYSLIKGTGRQPFAFTDAAGGYMVTEMLFYSEALGHIGRALNIFINMTDANVQWRDVHGPEYDLAAKILAEELDLAIQTWASRSAKVFGLAFFDRKKLLDGIKHELSCMKMALYIEHGCNCLRKIEMAAQSYRSGGDTSHWDFLDFCEYLSGAREVVTLLKSNDDEIYDLKWKQFCGLLDRIQKALETVVHEHKIPWNLDNIVLPSAVVNVSSTLRLVPFGEYKKFISITMKEILLAPGFDVVGFPPEGLRFLGPSRDVFPYMLEKFGLPPRFTGFYHVGPGNIDASHVELYRFYAALKSPVHMLALYGGLVFYLPYMEDKLIMTFDKGADILYDQPIVLGTKEELLTSELVESTSDFFLTRETSYLIPRDVGHPLPENYESPEKPSLTAFLALLSIRSVTSATVKSEPTLWRLCGTNLSWARLLRPWKPESLIGKIMMLSEDDRRSWTLSDNTSRPKLLIEYLELT